VKFSELTGLERTQYLDESLQGHEVDLMIQLTNVTVHGGIHPVAHVRGVDLKGAIALDSDHWTQLASSALSDWPKYDNDTLSASAMLDQGLPANHWALETSSGNRYLLECSKEGDGLRVWTKYVPVPAKRAYGPTITRVIQSSETGTNLFLNLDTGELLTPPDAIRELFKESFAQRVQWERESDPRAAKMRDWLRTSGANLLIVDVAHDLETLEIREAVIRSPNVISNGVNIPFGFDQVDASYLATHIEPMLASALPGRLRDGAVFTKPDFDIARNERRDTFCFKTARGAVGLFQIVNQEKNPRGARIRLKWLQPENRNGKGGDGARL
jgi:hypothetical protein